MKESLTFKAEGFLKANTSHHNPSASPMSFGGLYLNKRETIEEVDDE